MTSFFQPYTPPQKENNDKSGSSKKAAEEPFQKQAAILKLKREQESRDAGISKILGDNVRSGAESIATPPLHPDQFNLENWLVVDGERVPDIYSALLPPFDQNRKGLVAVKPMEITDLEDENNFEGRLYLLPASPKLN